MHKLLFLLTFFISQTVLSQDIINSNETFLSKDNFEHLQKEIINVKNDFGVSIKVGFLDENIKDISEYVKNDKSWVSINLSKNDDEIKILKSSDLTYISEEHIKKIILKDVIPQVKKGNLYAASLLATLEIKSILLDQKYAYSKIEANSSDYDKSLDYALIFFSIASVAYLIHIFRKQGRKREWQKTLKVNNRQVPKVNEKIDINIGYEKTIPMNSRVQPNFSKNNSSNNNNQYLNLNSFDYSESKTSDYPDTYSSSSDSSSSSYD